MKNYLFLSIICLISIAGFAGNPTNSSSKETTALVSGKIIDKVSGEEIAGAEIKIDSKTIYTDFNGNFSARIDVKNTDAVIKYISYKDKQTKINPYSYNTIVIELDSK